MTCNWQMSCPYALTCEKALTLDASVLALYGLESQACKTLCTLTMRPPCIECVHLHLSPLSARYCELNLVQSDYIAFAVTGHCCINYGRLLRQLDSVITMILLLTTTGNPAHSTYLCMSWWSMSTCLFWCFVWLLALHLAIPCCQGVISAHPTFAHMFSHTYRASSTQRHLSVSLSVFHSAISCKLHNKIWKSSAFELNRSRPLQDLCYCNDQLIYSNSLSLVRQLILSETLCVQRVVLFIRSVRRMQKKHQRGWSHTLFLAFDYTKDRDADETEAFVVALLDCERPSSHYSQRQPDFDLVTDNFMYALRQN